MDTLHLCAALMMPVGDGIFTIVLYGRLIEGECIGEEGTQQVGGSGINEEH